MRRVLCLRSLVLVTAVTANTLAIVSPAGAATINALVDPGPLVTATVASSVNVTTSMLTRPTSGATSAATATAFSHFPTHGTTFGILSTGDARVADDPNANFPDGTGNTPNSGERSTSWSTAASPGGHGAAFDTTTLRLAMDLVPTVNENCLLLDFAFYSEEFQEFVGQQYNDAFLAQLDTNTWSVNGSTGVITAPGNFAFDPNTNQPVSVNGSGPTTMTLANAAGTTYDGATPLLQAATPAAPGVHNLFLTVFDAADSIFDSAVFFDNIRWIHVNDPVTQCVPGAVPGNNPPTAVAGGPYTVNEGSTVPLSSAGSSDIEDGTNLTYGWSAPAPLKGTFDDATLATPTFTGVDDSSGPVTLTVTDTQGSSGTASTQMAVVNVAPSITGITVPGALVNVGDPVTVSATFTDPGSQDTHTWSIDWGDGTPPSTGSGAVIEATHAYAIPGNHPVTVTVTDDDGGQDVQVAPARVMVNHPPTAEANGPYFVHEGFVTQLDAAGSFDPEAGTLTYHWSSPTFGTLDDDTSPTPWYSGIDDGIDQLTLTVTDPEGSTGSDTADVTVVNVPPMITGITTPGHQVLVGDPVSVSATFTDPGVEDTHTWSIDWGDGSPLQHGTGVIDQVSHAYDFAGDYLVTVTVHDDDGGSDTQVAAAPIVVIANRPPTADAGGPYTVAEGSLVTLSAAGSTDPDGDPLTYAWTDGDPAVGVLTSAVTQEVDYAGRDDGTATVGVTVTDPLGASDDATAQITVTNVAPTITSLTVPVAPAAIGSVTDLQATFTDPGVADTHTAVVDWGDGTTPTAATVSGGTVTATHTYAGAGVYAVTLTVVDDDGGQAVATATEFVVVYDPSAGFVTGGGWYDSPAGAYAADPTRTGKANFGFVAKYKKGATVPDGNTQFQFKAGDVNFHSTAYEWLVIAGSRATYKGTGTINGAGDYGFRLTATDGQVSGGGGVDRIRLKVWDRATGAIVYDNQTGAPDDADATTALGGGSITVHSSK